MGRQFFVRQLKGSLEKRRRRCESASKLMFIRITPQRGVAFIIDKRCVCMCVALCVCTV